MIKRDKRKTQREGGVKRGKRGIKETRRKTNRSTTNSYYQ